MFGSPLTPSPTLCGALASKTAVPSITPLFTPGSSLVPPTPDRRTDVMQVAAITSAKFYTDGEPRTEVTLRPLSNNDVARYKA